MKRSKLIVSSILIIVLIAMIGLSLFACDFGGGSTGGTGTGGQGDDDGGVIGGDDSGGSGRPGNSGGRPTKPPQNNGGSQTTEDGVETVIYNAYQMLGHLMGGTQVEAEQAKYRIVNFYLDVSSGDRDTGEIKKKRLIFRTNIDQEGMANDFAVQLVDFTAIVDQPTLGADENVIFSDEENGNEVAISVSAAKLEEDLAYEAQGKIEWGFYAVDNKMFMDVGQNKPLLYFEDFDMDYMKQIMFKLKEIISDGEYDGLLNGPLFQGINLAGMTINDILGLVRGFIFDPAVCKIYEDPETGDVIKDYSCVVKVNELIENIGALVGLLPLLGAVLPFELQLEPLITFLTDFLPTMEVKFIGKMVNNKTKQFDLVVVNKDPKLKPTDPLYDQEIFRMNINTDRCYADTKYEIGIPQRVYDNVDFEPFSLTNIALSLDIVLDTPTDVDLAGVINSFVNKELLPEGVLILNVQTGLRLDLCLDLDLNYGQETTINEQGKEVLVDRNLIMLELYLIDKNGNYVDQEPLIGVYYKEGALYANVDHLLDRYYAGNNIKVNLGGVPDLIQYLINLVTNALDGALGTMGLQNWVNWKDLRQSRFDQITLPEQGETTPSEGGTITPDQGQGEVASAEEEYAAIITENVSCVALAHDEFGNYTVSMNLVSFLQSIGAIVGFGDIFGTSLDKKAIVITANQVFWDALNSLAKIEGFSWPGGLIAEIALNFDEVPKEFGSEEKKITLTHISISAAVDPRTGYQDAEGYWYIGEKASFKSLAFTTVGNTTIYSDTEMKTPLDMPEGDVISNYCVLYVNENRYYLDSAHTQEVMLGYDADGVQYAYKMNGHKTTIKSDNLNTKKKVKAYVYQGKWVIGYGHDVNEKVTEYLDTGVAVSGLSVAISLHDIMLCYGSQYLKRFDPNYGGTSYNGYFGAKTNLEGYILYRTHKRERVTGLKENSTGTYYVQNSLTGEYSKVELGTGEGQQPYDPLTSYYKIVEKGYVDSVSKFLTSILGGTFLSLNLQIDFKKGAYNLAPLIALFGLDAMKDKTLLWEFSDDFTMDVSLNIGIALDKNNPDNSKLVVELVTRNKVISIGGTELFPANTTILGLYGVGKKVYVEISNLRLLNIRLPDLYLELDYTTLIYTLLGEKEILDLTFDLAELLGLNATPQDQTVASSELSSPASAEFDPAKAMRVNVDSNVVEVYVTIAALQALLGSFGVDLGMDLNDVMNLAVNLELNRTEGIRLNISGALLPIYDKVTGENNFDHNLDILLQMGTDEAKVQIGDTTELMNNYNTKFDHLANSTSQFHEDIIEALINVIGDLSLTLTIDAETLQSVWDINRIVDTIVADQADKFALPLQVNFDDWKTQVQLKLQLYLDLDNFKNTQVLLEIIYENNKWIGVYIYQNSIVVDLNGLGLFDFELANSTVVAKAGNVLSNLLGSLGDLSLTSLLNGLIDDLLNPAPNTAGQEGEVAAGEVAAGEEAQAQEPATNEGDTANQEGEVAQAEEKEASNDLIAMILGAVSANNTTVSLNLTKDVFSQLFRELLGFDLFLALKVTADINILEGTINLGLDAEDGMVKGDIGIALDIGKERGAYKFNMNLDDIPDWNAINGTFMVRSLLKNLEIGLYIDLNQYTSTTGQPMYTRIYIEKLSKRTVLPKTGGAIAAKDSILVTLAGIDAAEFNNAGTGTKDIWLFAELNWMEGKLYLNICQGFLSLKILGGVAIDVGDVMGRLAIDLDLVTMLSGTIDNLLLQIEGLLDGLASSSTKEDLENVTPENMQQDESLANKNVSNGTIQFATIKTAGEMGRKTIAENVGKFYYNNNQYKEIVEEDGSVVAKTLTVNTDYSDKTFNDLPIPSESNVGIIYETDKTQVLDEAGNPVLDANSQPTYSYSYYICRSVTRRTFAYYTVEVVSGLSGFFSGLDILSLFGKVELSLTSTGILNADVLLDEYTINYVIDNLMFYIFGPESILDLKEMTAGSNMEFSDNWLAYVYWNRVNGGEFFNDLWNVVDDILGDVLKGLIGMDLSGLMGAISNLKSTLQNIINRLLPFAVGNENHLGLNIVRGQLTNIYLTMQDHNTAIVDHNNNPYTFFNGKKTLEYTAGSRGDQYYTELHIFNTSPSVGNSAYIGNPYNGVSYSGSVIWDGVPSSITYDPYAYASAEAAFAEISEKYFNNKEASYQEGQKLYKSAIDFKIIDFTPGSSDKQIQNATAQNQYEANITLEKLGNFTTPGVYTIRARAPFNNGNTTKDLMIKFRVLSNDPIDTIDSISKSVYGEFPAYLRVTTTDGVVRRYGTDKLKFFTGDDPNAGIKHNFAYVNPDSVSGDWTQTIKVQFPNGEVSDALEVTFTNSTIANVIIGNAKNNVIEIDLYQFDTKREDGTVESLANYTPSTLFFYYPNGIADSLEVEWDYGDANQLFDRLDPEKDGVYGSTAGAAYDIYATAMKGTDVEQTVKITLNVKSRTATSVIFGDKTDLLEIQPYEYYLYNMDPNKYAKFNPYSDQVTVNYDEYYDDVYVVWEGIDTNINYGWNVSGDTSSTASVTLDKDQYPSGDVFTWTRAINVLVARNEISAIYFDKALTKSSLVIDPYVYNNLEDKRSYYPKTAFVKFTNGSVIELPIAWDWNQVEAYTPSYFADTTQFTITIGHDVAHYSATGEITPFALNGANPFIQQTTIVVEVDATEIAGILLDGSEYLPGTCYMIDPVKVNYQGAQPFPNIVSVRYKNGKLGTINVHKWEGVGAEQIKMDGSGILEARCYVTNDLSFPIKCQVHDRGASRMEVDTSYIESDKVNPYNYIKKSDGTLTYDVFEEYLTVSYTTSYTLTVKGSNGKTYYNKTVATDAEYNAERKNIKQMFNYAENGNKYIYIESVTENGETVNTPIECELIIKYNKTNYDLPVYWDTSRLNITNEGSKETVYYYFGYGTDNQIEKFVDVEFATKVVDKIEGDDYVFVLQFDGANLTETEKQSGRATRKLEVFFIDDTSAYVDCVIDLTTLYNAGGVYGYNAGKTNLTQFNYNAASVNASTAGNYYVQGAYYQLSLKAGEYDTTKTYYNFTQVSELVEGNTYYMLHNGNYIKIVYNGSNFHANAEYFVREVIDINGGNYQGTAFEYNNEDFAEVTLTGAGILYNENTTYYTLTISNEMYAQVIVAEDSGLLAQTLEVKVYVI